MKIEKLTFLKGVMLASAVLGASSVMAEEIVSIDLSMTVDDGLAVSASANSVTLTPEGTSIVADPFTVYIGSNTDSDVTVTVTTLNLGLPTMVEGEEVSTPYPIQLNAGMYGVTEGGGEAELDTGILTEGDVLAGNMLAQANFVDGTTDTSNSGRFTATVERATGEVSPFSAGDYTGNIVLTVAKAL